MRKRKKTYLRGLKNLDFKTRYMKENCAIGIKLKQVVLILKKIRLLICLGGSKSIYYVSKGLNKSICTMYSSTMIQKNKHAKMILLEFVVIQVILTINIVSLHP